jgi:non-specific serine/threonine protein kinase
LATLPERISGAGAVVVGGRLLVTSGENTTVVVPTVLAYDLTASTGEWATLPALPAGRHGLAVAAVGNTLYAIGGSLRPGHTASTDTVNALTFS